MSTTSLVMPESLVPYLTGQLKDYSSIQGTVIRCNVVFIAVVVLSSGLRMFVRFRLLYAAGIDDGKFYLVHLNIEVLCALKQRLG